MADALYCLFRNFGGYCKCVRVGCPNWFAGEDCSAAKIPCSASGSVRAASLRVPEDTSPQTLAEMLPCVQRGEKGKRIKCQCRAGGVERWIDTYECRSPHVKQKRCVLAGQLREPEAGLYAVCADCRVREPARL